MANNAANRLLLEEADRLLSSESIWTKGTFARDSAGNPTQLEGSTACRFCIAGAVYRAQHSIKTGNSSDVLQMLWVTVTKSTAYLNLAAFNDNDNTTFPMVKKAIADTIARL